MMHICPWTNFEPATMHFCEEQLCSWIRQPANTWTNIGFILVGLWICFRHYKNNSMFTLLGISSIVVGIGSTLFHLSGTFMFEVVDVFGMFLISSLMISLNLWRGWPHHTRWIILFYLGLNAFSLALLISYKTSGIPMFAAQIYLAITLEMYLYIREDTIDYRNLKWMVFSFVGAFTFWGLDISKILCLPSNHILTGHGIWHLLNATALYFFYKFHHQFLLGKTHAR